MPTSFIERVWDLVEAPRSLTGAERAEALTAFEDTMAVAYAGWHEPVTQAVLDVYRGTAVPMLDGGRAGSIEHAALVQATAAHALDYDDVQLTGVTHPSVALVPGLLAVATSRPETTRRVISAYAVGLGVNIAVSRIFGFSHYDKGWHATCTIGPVAGAAALAHLLEFDRGRTRDALALAAAQAGGMQRNFGAMAKPAQVGFAAASGVRAALLAEAGVTGDDDAFGPKGYFALYAGPEHGEDVDSVPVEIDLGSLARKLYPCCYLTHRLIAAGFEARAQLPGGVVPDGAEIRVTVPFGGLRPLRVIDPRTGLEAKFCGAYTIAASLLQNSVTLADFEDAAIHRPAIRNLMRRVVLTEEPLKGDMPIGLDHGTVRLRIDLDGRTIAAADIAAHPGSPARRATAAEMTTKIEDCLALYRLRAGVGGPSLAEFRSQMRAQVGMERAEMEAAHA